jgi:Bacterial PH domain
VARPELDDRFRSSKLPRYLLADETVIVAQRQHWAVLWKEIALFLGALFVVVTLNVLLPPGAFTDFLWWAMLGVTIWVALKWYEWRRNWMVATDKRVMVNYGLIRQGVAMFSLSRVPDLTYTRSTVGQLLGYGELKRESAGAGQTLHTVRFVEHPHATYTTICAAIFELQDRMFGMDDDEDDERSEGGPPQQTFRPYSEHVADGRRQPTDAPGSPGSPGSPGESSRDGRSDQGDDLIGTPVRYGTPQPSERDTSSQHPDLGDSALRDPGPIPYRRPATDEGQGWVPTTTNEEERARDRDRSTDRD